MAITTPSVIRVTINPNLKFASGSIVSAVNVGTGEGSVLQSSSGGALNLRTIKAGNYIEVVNGVNEISINASGTVPDIRTINNYPLTADIILTKNDLTLDQVDNTSDLNKPLSSASIAALATKIDSNIAITGGTFTKVTVDSKGLVTLGTGAFTSDISDSVDKRYVTDANLIVIGNTSNTNTGDETQSTIKQKLGSASVSQDGYLNQADFTTFNNKQNSLGYTPENISNKSTNVSLGISDTLYPSQNAVKTYVETYVAASGSSNTFQNVGIGEGELYATTSGSIVSFRTIKASGNIAIQTDIDEIIISSTGSSSPGGGVKLHDIFIGNNIQTDFTLSGTVEPSDISQVYLQGVLQAETVEYNIISGSILKFSTAPQDLMQVDTFIFGQGTSSSSISAGINLGSGTGLYTSNSGYNLQFKSLIAGNNVSLDSNSTSIIINASGGVSSTLWGSISGSLYNQTDLQNELTSLSGSIVNRELSINKSTNTSLGTSNTLYPSQNAVKVYVDTNISASSSVITASNLGTGEGLYSQKVGNDLQFKSLIAGNNITLSSSSVGITINSTASGSSGTGSVTVENIQNNSFTYALSTGSSNVYLINLNPPLSAYTAGNIIHFVAGFEATGSVKLNVNSLGEVGLKKYYNQEIRYSDIVQNQAVSAIYDGSNYQVISPLSERLSGNLTINFNNTMAATQMQALIDRVPKNLNGYTLTFQFADGTYTLNTQLVFTNFLGGTVKVFGNASNNSLSTTKAVTLNFTSSTGINSNGCCATEIRYLDVYIANAVPSYGIYTVLNPYSIIRYNYVHCSQAGGSGIFLLSANALVIDNMLGLCGNGIAADGNSSIYSENNDDAGAGNQPVYGLATARTGVIGKNGTQPSGSVSNEKADTGGVIR